MSATTVAIPGTQIPFPIDVKAAVAEASFLIRRLRLIILETPQFPQFASRILLKVWRHPSNIADTAATSVTTNNLIKVH